MINKNDFTIGVISVILISFTMVFLQLQINKIKINYELLEHVLDIKQYEDIYINIHDNDQKDLIEQIGRLKEKSDQLNKEIELQQLNNIALQKEKWGLEQELINLQ